MQKIILVFIVIIILLSAVLGLYFLFANPASKSNLPSDGSATNSQNNNPMAKGLKVEIYKEGTGLAAKTGDVVTVNYVGMLANGTKFDSTIDRNSPFTFPIGQERVIKGFDMGVLGMKVGERRKITIPAELGYGSTKLALIPANSTLVYDIEMLKISR